MLVRTSRALAALVVVAVAPTAHAEFPFAIGGAGLDYGKDLRVDPFGNVISGGYFSGTVDFDPSPAGTANLTAAGTTAVDNYLAKYAPNGDRVWSLRFGGSGSDIPHTIRTDAAGGILMGGYFSTSGLNGGRVSFNPTSNLTQYTLTSVGDRDPYVVKFDAGGQYQWHAGVPNTIATANYDETYDVCVDAPSGSVYAVGLRNADAAPPNPLTTAGGWVAKYSSAGAAQWDFNLGTGTTGVVQAFAAGTLANGDLVVAGQFNVATDFGHGVGAPFTLTPTGNADVFLAKYRATDGACLGAVKLGGTGFDTSSPGGLIIDAADQIYLTGNLSGTVDPDNNPATANNVTSNGAGDVLLAKFDAGLSRQWLRLVGGTAGDGGHRLELDAAGNPILTGWFRNAANFGPGRTLVARSSLVVGQDPIASDIFLAKFDAATGATLWADGFGNAATVSGDFSLGAGLGVTAMGEILLGGRFDGTVDWDPGAGLYTLTSAGSTDAFVARFDAAGNLVVPEPATLSLLTSGLLLLTRRRR